MPRVSEEEQASEGRVAAVREQLTRALVKSLDAHPDLTYEEVLTALLIVAERQVAHMRAGGTL